MKSIFLTIKKSNEIGCSRMMNEGNDKKAEYALLYLKGVYSGLVEIRMRRKLLFILTI